MSETLTDEQMAEILVQAGVLAQDPFGEERYAGLNFEGPLKYVMEDARTAFAAWAKVQDRWESRLEISDHMESMCVMCWKKDNVKVKSHTAKGTDARAMTMACCYALRESSND